jgi:SAM-dependent methyltransferase
MGNLYSNLAEVYEAMYKTFIDYEEEFNLYKQMLLKYNCKSVVEIGCGTGNLASRFVESGFEYIGLDTSDEMLDIAKRNNPGCNFIRARMQDFVLTRQAGSAIITGRTISYLLTNSEVNDCFSCIHKNLEAHGILCFDFIDANKFIPSIGKDCVKHKTTAGNNIFHRESFWKVNFSQGWNFDWLSVFYKEQEDGSLEKIGEDNSTIRAFTEDEIILFLQLTGFRVNELITRKTYAFDTFLVIAEKIS